MNVRNIVLLIGISWTLSVGAHQGTPPRSFADAASAKARVQILTLDEIDAEKLLNEDQTQAKRGLEPGPIRFALPADMKVSPKTHGTWTKTAAGAIWRLEIEAPGATDLNFGFSKYRMPDGATLHVFSPFNSYYQGPYTKAHQQEHGQLWTPVIPGEVGIIELFVPTQVAYQPEIELTRVGRGYRDLFKLGLSAALKAGACNNNVACSVGAPWADQIRSVAVYGTNGSTFCTGTLINNVEQNQRPFFITANHCGLSASNAASVVAYWNFESPTCGQVGGGTLSDNTSGATFRASESQNDMTLIEFNSTPLATYNVYYAGWDARTSTAPQGGVGIHHPNTDEKAISFNTDPLITSNSCIGTGGSNTHWTVDNWEDGTTEPGSSGSGLFDPATKRLVGYLSGGSASCSNPGGSDCYGKISVGWGRGLSNWLDPVSTGTRFVNGLDSGGAPPPPPPPPPAPGVTQLNNGDTVTGQSGAAGDWLYFKIAVPSGASNLQMTMSGGSGDADLYTRFGSKPTTTSYDCRPYSGGNNESCPVATPTVGDYYIGIRGYSSFSNVSLSVSFNVAAAGGGFTLPNLSASRRQWKHYTLDVPAGMASLKTKISGGSGDADLYVRFGAQPTTGSYNCRPYANGNNENCNFTNPQAGTWYISIRAYQAYSGVTLDANYTP